MPAPYQIPYVVRRWRGLRARAPRQRSPSVNVDGFLGLNDCHQQGQPGPSAPGGRFKSRGRSGTRGSCRSRSTSRLRLGSRSRSGARSTSRTWFQSRGGTRPRPSSGARFGSSLGPGQRKNDTPSTRPDPSPRADCGHTRGLRLSGAVHDTEDQSRGKSNLTWADRVRSNDGEQPTQCDPSPGHARDAEISRLKQKNAELKDTLTKMANEMAEFKRMLSTMRSNTEENGTGSSHESESPAKTYVASDRKGEEPRCVDSPTRTVLIERIVWTELDDEELSGYVMDIEEAERKAAEAQREETEEAKRIRVQEAKMRALDDDIARMNSITRAQHRKRLQSCICSVCVEPKRCGEVASTVQCEVTEKAAVCEVPPEKGTRLYQCDIQSYPSAERKEQQVVVSKIAPRESTRLSDGAKVMHAESGTVAGMQTVASPKGVPCETEAGSSRPGDVIEQIYELETTLELQQGNDLSEVEKEDDEGSPKGSEDITLLKPDSTASEVELLLKSFPTDRVGMSQRVRRYIARLS
ncbi:hypothetical protein HPB51_007448 [Rhipicephalus microplus]|uniref:Uncharacterized protein n=1 Tax=Rhipicephalus microplus TaxID=6941 RepID=A0A9J6EYM1_RHIMP|nr:hypothetical protein HPB51_007448 [Rhipicephalus microplus]